MVNWPGAATTLAPPSAGTRRSVQVSRVSPTRSVTRNGRGVISPAPAGARSALGGVAVDIEKPQPGRGQALGEHPGELEQQIVAEPRVVGHAGAQAGGVD